MNKFNYENTEVVAQKGGKIVRKVSIKKGRGYKTITKYHRGKKLYTVKKPIHSSHVKLIKKGKFIPGLFKDCKNCKTKKRRGGNGEEDIEMGRDSPTDYLKKIPPDPERFKQYEEQIRMEAFKPVTSKMTEAIFSGPTPEEKEELERQKMSWQDPRIRDPYEDLKIFDNSSGGKKRNYRK